MKISPSLTRPAIGGSKLARQLGVPRALDGVIQTSSAPRTRGAAFTELKTMASGDAVDRAVEALRPLRDAREYPAAGRNSCSRLEENESPMPRRRGRIADVLVPRRARREKTVLVA